MGCSWVSIEAHTPGAESGVVKAGKEDGIVFLLSLSLSSRDGEGTISKSGSPCEDGSVKHIENAGRTDVLARPSVQN